MDLRVPRTNQLQRDLLRGKPLFSSLLVVRLETFSPFQLRLFQSPARNSSIRSQFSNLWQLSKQLRYKHWRCQHLGKVNCLYPIKNFNFISNSTFQFTVPVKPGVREAIFLAKSFLSNDVLRGCK